VKRVGFIYDSICDINNIKKAIMKSSLGKRRRIAKIKRKNRLSYKDAAAVISY